MKFTKLALYILCVPLFEEVEGFTIPRSMQKGKTAAIVTSYTSTSMSTSTSSPLFMSDVPADGSASSSSACPFSSASNFFKNAPTVEPYLEELPPPINTDSNAYPSRKPDKKDWLFQRFQIYTLSHPRGLIGRFIQPIVTTLDGFAGNFATNMSARRAAFGENFIVGGMVCLSGWEDVQRGFTSPQARTNKLGPLTLSEKQYPRKEDGSNTFLLDISQEEVGGDGSHRAYRDAFIKYIVEGAEEAQNDTVSQKLMEQVTKDFQEMKDGEFFTSKERGLVPFLSDYLHHVLFGFDPVKDREDLDFLLNHYSQGDPPAFQSMYYISVPTKNGSAKDDTKKSVEKVSKMYEMSPKLANYPKDAAEFKNLSKAELCELAVGIITIAAYVGSYYTFNVCLGNKPTPVHNGEVQEKPNMNLSYLDTIDIKDPEEVFLYILECLRLDPPVGGGHNVAQEPFTVKMLGKDRTFPAGTPILIPINLSSINENVFGDTTFEWDHKRPNLKEYSTHFQCVGKNHHGRICPGANIVVRMATEVIQRIGEARRQ